MYGVTTATEVTKSLLALQFNHPIEPLALEVVVDRPPGCWRARLMGTNANFKPVELASGAGRLMDQALRDCLVNARKHPGYIAPEVKPKAPALRRVP